MCWSTGGYVDWTTKTLLPATLSLVVNFDSPSGKTLNSASRRRNPSFSAKDRPSSSEAGPARTSFSATCRSFPPRPLSLFNKLRGNSDSPLSRESVKETRRGKGNEIGWTRSAPSATLELCCTTRQQSDMGARTVEHSLPETSFQMRDSRPKHRKRMRGASVLDSKPTILNGGLAETKRSS